MADAAKPAPPPRGLLEWVYGLLNGPPAPSAAAQVEARLARGRQAGAKATGLRAHPEASTARRLLNLATGYPLPGEVGAGGDVAMAALPLAGALRPLTGLVRETRIANPIRAYHGSPHDFEMFDLSKIGTGEGAQAFGHGLYFAENPATAMNYRESLAGRAEIKSLRLGNRTIGQQTGFDYNPRGTSNYENIQSSLFEDLLINEQAMTGLSPDDVQAHVLRTLDQKIADYQQEWPEAVSAAQQLRRDLSRKGAVRLEMGEKPGKTYEVNIHADPAHFLDWDARLKEQPPTVKALANRIFGPRLQTREIGSGLVDVRERGGGSLGAFPTERVPDVLANPAEHYPYKGSDFYEQLADVADAKKRGSMPYADRRIAASEALNKASVPGIKYLDQSSRAAGEGTRNFVVFDPRLIEIAKKYMLAGLGIEEAMRRARADLAAPAPPEAR